jgi:hypothetical protein
MDVGLDMVSYLGGSRPRTTPAWTAPPRRGGVAADGPPVGHDQAPFISVTIGLAIPGWSIRD